MARSSWLRHDYLPGRRDKDVVSWPPIGRALGEEGEGVFGDAVTMTDLTTGGTVDVARSAGLWVIEGTPLSDLLLQNGVHEVDELARGLLIANLVLG